VIVKPTPIRGNRGETIVHACYDSGSGVSLLRRDIADRVGSAPLPAPRSFGLADGERRVEAQEEATLDVTIKGVVVFYTFYVVEQLSDDMIIGSDMLQRWKIELDPENEDVDIDPNVVARIRV